MKKKPIWGEFHGSREQHKCVSAYPARAPQLYEISYFWDGKKKEDLHATFLSIKTELVMLENVIHFTKSHIVWTLECRRGLLKSSESVRVLSERERKSCPWC